MSKSTIDLLTDSREQSISCFREWLGENQYSPGQTGKIWLTETAGSVDTLQKILAERATSEEYPIIFISLRFPTPELIDILSQLTEKKIDFVLAHHECYQEMVKGLREEALRVNTLGKRTEKNGERIWVQYRLWRAINARTESIEQAIEKIVKKIPESGVGNNDTVVAKELAMERQQAKAYFMAQEPDMAGGTYRYGDDEQQNNHIDSLREQLLLHALTDDSVLLVGESGTGKEAAAWILHDFNPQRRNKPYVTFNCAGLSDELILSGLFGYVKGAFSGAIKDTDGLVQKAQGGTLFLDELPDMSARSQAALLRFLENGEYYRVGDPNAKRADIRIVAAGQPLRLAEKGKVREDLLHRLGLPLAIPALNEIKNKDPEDLLKIAGILLERFIGEMYPQKDLTSRHASPLDVNELKKRLPDIREKLLAMDWSGGNVRLLRNLLRKWMVDGQFPPPASGAITNYSLESGSLGSLDRAEEPGNIYLFAGDDQCSRELRKLLRKLAPGASEETQEAKISRFAEAFKEAGERAHDLYVSKLYDYFKEFTGEESVPKFAKILGNDGRTVKLCIVRTKSSNSKVDDACQSEDSPSFPDSVKNTAIPLETNKTGKSKARGKK